MNHLSASDHEIDDFIRLRKLNRHLLILIDSDKSTPHSRINSTKRRVKGELEQDTSGFVWITDCRMIENYVPLRIFAASVSAVSSATLKYAGGRWEHPFENSGRVTIDKIKLAHAVCDAWDESTELLYDLRRRLWVTIRFIRDANGLDSDGN